jgi:hypothetical protein
VFGDVLTWRDFIPGPRRRRRRRLTAREIAESIEFWREVALHTAEEYLRQCDVEPKELYAEELSARIGVKPKLVDVSALRERLRPRSPFSKRFLEEMAERGVSKSTLYRILAGKKVRLETHDTLADALGHHELRLNSYVVPRIPALVGDVRLAGMLLRSPQAIAWANGGDWTWETFSALPEEDRAFAIEHFHNRGQQAIAEALEWLKVKVPITPARVLQWRFRAARAGSGAERRSAEPRR